MNAFTFFAFLGVVLSPCLSQRPSEDPAAGLSDEIINRITNKLEESWNVWKMEENQLPGDFDQETGILMKVLDYAEKLYKGEDDMEDVEDLSEQLDMDDSIDYDSLVLPEPEPLIPGGSHSDDSISDSMHEHHKQRIRNQISRKVKNYRKLIRHPAAKWDVSNLANQCMNLSDKVEMLCSRVSLVRSSSKLHKLFNLWSEKTRGKGAWNTCCTHQTVETRYQCFQKKRKTQYNRACRKSRPSRSKSSRCCRLRGNERVDCFEEPKNRLCGLLNSDGTPKDGLRFGDIIPPNQRGSVQHHGRGHSEWMRCCDAARAYTNYSSSSSPLECAAKFTEWLNSTEIPSFSCAKGFLKCCANMTGQRFAHVIGNWTAEVENSSTRNSSTDNNYSYNIMTTSRNHTHGRNRHHHRHGGSGGFRSWWKDSAATRHQHLLCCQAGSALKKTDVATDDCEEQYGEWAQSQDMDLPDLCVDKFVSCCMNGFRRHGHHSKLGAGWTNVRLATIHNMEITSDGRVIPDETGQQVVEFMPFDKEPTVTWVDEPQLPDETGQQVVEYMPFDEEPTVTWVDEPQLPDETGQQVVAFMSMEEDEPITWADESVDETIDCCHQGMVQSRDIIGKANHRRCNFQLSLFARQTEVDEDCVTRFMSCCNPQEGHSRGRATEEAGGRKIKKQRDPLVKSQRPLPDGMRVDKHGRTYYVDRRLPPVVKSRNRHGKRG